VIRLLGEAADGVPPLDEVEVASFLRVATGSRPRSRGGVPWRPRLLSLGAVAAAVALAVMLPAAQDSQRRPASVPQTGVAAQPVSFPAGSALSLLLSPSEGRA
jgi:hypothetical protein